MIPAFWLLKKLEAKGLSGSRIRNIELLRIKYGIKDIELLKKSGIILILVIIAFFLHSAYPHPLFSVATIAIAGAVIMLLVTSPHKVEEQLDSVEWTTIIFFAGLFIMIHGLEYMGLIDKIAELISSTIAKASEENRLMVAVLLLLWVSAIASAFIDNIPYTATMIPIVLTLSVDLSLDLGPLIWALAFGACLGGNGTLIGASANVVTAGMSEEAGYPISFNEFFKAGFPVMLMTVTIITGYVVMVYWVDEIWKWILLAVALLGIVWQYYNGKSKGKNWAEALVDDESIIDITVAALPLSSKEEE